MKIAVIMHQNNNTSQKLIDNIKEYLNANKQKCVHEITFTNKNSDITNEGKNYFLTWVSSIIDFYKNIDTFPDFILFLREDPLKHTPFETEIKLFDELIRFPHMFLDKTYWLLPLKCTKNGLPHHPNLPVDTTYNMVFPNQKVPEIFEFESGAQGMKSKNRFLERPLIFYENLYKQLEAGLIDIYAMERIFSYI